MRFGAKIVKGYCNINDFSYAAQHEMNEGENSRLYLQLCDLDQKLASDINGTLWQRYMPPSGSSLQIDIAGINDATKITKIANQVSGDSSLWYIDFLPTETVASGNLHLTLTEPASVIRKGVITEGIKVYPTGAGSVSFC